MSKGFSLIELMVVIAIVAILSSVAYPSYKNYIIRTKITSSVAILQALNAKFLEKFNMGTLGSSFTTNGITFNNGANVVYTAPPVERVVYYNNNGGIPATNLFTCVFLSGLEGMVASSGAAYVAASSSATGTRNRICIYNVPNSTTGIIQQYCGIWSTDTGNAADLYLPAEHLPPNCNCTNLSSGSC